MVGTIIKMKNNEKRKNPRIPVSVAVSCITSDLNDTPTNFYMAVVKNISQRGVLVDLFGELETDTVLLSFITVKNEPIEIKCENCSRAGGQARIQHKSARMVFSIDVR
jgi:hypothetical protein